MSSLEPSACTNNNSLPHEVSMEELELLKKLEEQNRYVQTIFFLDFHENPHHL